MESLNPILENETAIRLGTFGGLFALFAIIEAVYPRRVRGGSRTVRWYSNLGMSFLNSFALRFIFPVMGIGMAQLCTERGWGFFNDFQMPYALAFILAVLALDFVVYLHHIMFHAVPLLWRLHQVHHTDIDLDASSGIRFHVIESVISMVIKLGAIVLIGPPMMAVLFFEIVLNGAAMFNHANMRIPLNVDRVLRLFVVTPDMHRVHHSIIRSECNSNYGFNVPWWDFIFRTYNAQPKEGHDGMTIGMKGLFRSGRDQHMHNLLIQPFLSHDPDAYPDRGAESEQVYPELSEAE